MHTLVASTFPQFAKLRVTAASQHEPASFQENHCMHDAYYE